VAGGRSSLCVLGAGNLNDLHLDRLLGCYARLDLVDLDVGAVRAAVARHRPDRPAEIRVHGPVDLSGILQRLPTASRDGDNAEELCGALAGHRCAVEGQPFDVTVSTGLLTQLLQSVVDSSLPPSDTVAVRLALRDKHLADLVRLTRPGGTVALITDVVSTSTAPDLLDAGPARLEQRLAELVARRNFFTGTNPYRIMAVLEEDERLRGLVTGLRLLRPWLWQVTPDRHHLTVAVVARRTAAPADGPLLSEAAEGTVPS
jgi:hypothetical protein